jgi:hypothetical protein
MIRQVELEGMRRWLERSCKETIPAPVLSELVRDKWKLFFSALPTDLWGEQKEPLVTDQDDGRIWVDQIGGCCYRVQKFLYVSLFLATNKELTSHKRYEPSRLAGNLRHEIAHAFDVLLAALTGYGKDISFSFISPAFRKAVAIDILAAGGVGGLKEAGLEDCTPGNVRPTRDLEEIFAEGMAIIWGGGCLDWQYRKAFIKKFPTCMATLGKINSAFLATDWTNERSRLEFRGFVERQWASELSGMGKHHPELLDKNTISKLQKIVLLSYHKMWMSHIGYFAAGFLGIILLGAANLPDAHEINEKSMGLFISSPLIVSALAAFLDAIYRHKRASKAVLRLRVAAKALFDKKMYDAVRQQANFFDAKSPSSRVRLDAQRLRALRVFSS